MSARGGLLLVCRLALCSWLLVVLVALHAPTPSAMPASRQLWVGAGELLPDAPALFSDLIGDKTLHVLLFAPLSALALGCRRLARRPTRMVAPVLLALAVTSELLQQLGGRIADPLDVVANGVGILIGAVVVAALRRVRSGLRVRRGA